YADLGHEHGGEPGPTLRRRPHGQIEQDTGEEPSFAGAEQTSQNVQVPIGGDECGHRAAKAPDHHDPKERFSNSDLLQEQVAGDLQKNVTEIKDAGAETVYRFGEPQILDKLKLRKADIRAIDKRDQITEHQERNDTPVDFSIGRISLRSSIGGNANARRVHAH